MVLGSLLYNRCRSLYRLCMKGHFGLWVWFVGWLYYIGHGWVNNSSCSSTWPVISVVPNVYHCSHQVLSPTVLSLANCSTQNSLVLFYVVSSGHTSNNHSEYSGGWNSMSQIKRCQSKWCNVNGFKGLNWSQDKADDINVGGNTLYGCVQFFLCQEVNWFIIIYFWYAFFFYHSVSAWNVCKWDCSQLFHFSIWFSGFRI